MTDEITLTLTRYRAEALLAECSPDGSTAGYPPLVTLAIEDIRAALEGGGATASGVDREATPTGSLSMIGTSVSRLRTLHLEIERMYSDALHMLAQATPERPAEDAPADGIDIAAERAHAKECRPISAWPSIEVWIDRYLRALDALEAALQRNANLRQTCEDRGLAMERAETRAEQAEAANRSVRVCDAHVDDVTADGPCLVCDAIEQRERAEQAERRLREEAVRQQRLHGRVYSTESERDEARRAAEAFAVDCGVLLARMAEYEPLTGWPEDALDAMDRIAAARARIEEASRDD